MDKPKVASVLEAVATKLRSEHAAPAAGTAPTAPSWLALLQTYGPLVIQILTAIFG